MISRFIPKKYDVGLGPQPLINNVYHKKALNKYGYKTVTFVCQTYFITREFDIILNIPILNYYILYFYSIYNCKILYIYFNGGSLYNTTYKYIESSLYKLANVKTVVMPYGADVQDLTRCNNIIFKNNIFKDYPTFKMMRTQISKKIDIWTRGADYIISGCEWVDYMYHWDKLLLSHFSIDTEEVKPNIYYKFDKNKTIKILHVPNHKNIKGTKYFIKAIEELKSEGYNLEFIMVQRVPNSEVKKFISEADIIADQLVIGWYAMYAIEAMAMGKPVICYLREDLYNLYIEEGLIEKDEIPLINANIFNIKDVLRNILNNPNKILELGKKGRDFVLKHHSLEAIGKHFDEINRYLLKRY
ncbi:MAG: hypothetical protein AB1567_10690 [bacterium]